LEAIPVVELNVQIIKKNGKSEYVILPYAEFLKVQEDLDDYHDLLCLREAKEVEKSAATIGIDELKNSLMQKNRKASTV
jgi:hypothetical protein